MTRQEQLQADRGAFNAGLKRTLAQRTKRFERPAKEAEWPTKDELAECIEVGCMMCGAPGTEIAVEAELTGLRTAYVEDGEIVWGDVNALHQTERIFCSACKETFWQR